MVDIFEVTPQSNPSRAPPAFPYAHDPQTSRYQNLLSRLSVADDEPVDGVHVDWLPAEHDDNIEMRSEQGKGDDKPLVGTFADAAAAMV